MEPLLPGEEPEHNDNTFPKNNREVDETNGSIEDLDYPVTSLAFGFLLFTNWEFEMEFTLQRSL